MYLAWVGAFTACAYPLSCQVTLHGTPLLRYLVFVVFVPVGLCATYFRRERIAALRGFVAVVFVAWSAMNLVDHARVIRQAIAEPPHSLHRELADFLTSRGVRYARAVYWDAYIVDFLARERVIVSSLDISRHPEYERQVDAHASSAVMITRQPCEGPATVALWCVTR
jgi:very-short-patch-repair endonuclease